MPLMKKFRSKRTLKKSRPSKSRLIRRRPLIRRKRVFSRNVPEYASCSVSRTLQGAPGSDFLSGVFYQYRNISLADFPRAVQVAQAYQFFRIKSIKYTFKTYADTYATGGAGRPNLYWLIDRGQNLVNTSAYTLENLKQMGCRPTACDERPKSFVFRPAVNEAILGNAASATLWSKPRLSPWLSTYQNASTASPWTPSQVPHSGMCWVMEQANPPNGPTYGVDIEVQFQFMKPLVQLETSAPQAIKAVIAEINNSPDGIVGGHDGI